MPSLDSPPLSNLREVLGDTLSLRQAAGGRSGHVEELFGVQMYTGKIVGVSKQRNEEAVG